MSNAKTLLYTGEELVAYVNGRLDFKHEILKELNNLRAMYANKHLWEQAVACDLMLSKIHTPLAEDEEPNE
jgi:hypothetical protein